jgi:mutator protein MutT
VIIIVVAAIIRRDNTILITRRFDHVHLPGFWEFPGGKVRANESLPDALEREIREELGVTITVDDEFFRTEHDYPDRTIRLHFFNCIIRAGEPRRLEVADFRWVQPSELRDFRFPPADEELIVRLQASALPD